MNGVFFFVNQLVEDSFLCIRIHLAEADFASTQDRRHEEAFTFLVGHEHGHFVVAGLVAVVNDVGRIVGKLLFFTEIAVMDDGVDVANGAVEADLVEVIVTAGVVQVKQAAIFQWLRLGAVRDALARQVL